MHRDSFYTIYFTPFDVLTYLFVVLLIYETVILSGPLAPVLYLFWSTGQKPFNEAAFSFYAFYAQFEQSAHGLDSGWTGFGSHSDALNEWWIKLKFMHLLLPMPRGLYRESNICSNSSYCIQAIVSSIILDTQSSATEVLCTHVWQCSQFSVQFT